MPHTGSTRVSLTTVAILVGLLAGGILGPAPIEAADPMPQGEVFAPIGVTVNQEVRLIYHNFTKDEVKVQFLLLDENGQDLFTLNNIIATMIVAPGTMAMGVVPCSGILGPNQTRAEVTGVVALWPVPPQMPFKPGSFVGPASLQLVDELTQRTLLAFGGIVGPVDLVGIVAPVD